MVSTLALHPGDLVAAAGRTWRVLFVRGDWVTVRGDRGESARFRRIDIALTDRGAR